MVTTPGIVREESDIMAMDLSVSLELSSVVALLSQEPREAWRVKVQVLLPLPLSTISRPGRFSRRTSLQKTENILFPAKNLHEILVISQAVPWESKP